MDRQLVKRTNQWLREAGYRITIEVVGRSLCLRGILPPRPDVNKPLHQARFNLHHQHFAPGSLTQSMVK